MDQTVMKFPKNRLQGFEVSLASDHLWGTGGKTSKGAKKPKPKFNMLLLAVWSLGLLSAGTHGHFPA
jgi:hypothetical protein